MIGLDLLATRSAMSGNAGGGVATWVHLGGAATAWVYLRYGDRVESSLRRFDPRRRRLGVERGRTGARTKPAPKRERRSRTISGDSLDEVDRILDKIKDTGIESLTAEEKAYLDDMSRRYRGSE